MRKWKLVGRRCYEVIVHPDDLDVILNATSERLKGESGKYELRMLRKDGVIIWSEISGSPLLDDDDKVIGSIGLITDIRNGI